MVSELNDSEGGLWDAYLRVLKMYIQPSANSAPQDMLIRLLEMEVFAKLIHERQLAVCEAVIGVIARDLDAVSSPFLAHSVYIDDGKANLWQKITQ